jgi:hypothetical protein
LFATVFALAAPLLSSVATNMRCNRGGFSVICRWRGAPALQPAPTGDNVRAIGAAG